MNHAVTMRVKHYTVAHSIASTVDVPDDLMATPSIRNCKLMHA